MPTFNQRILFVGFGAVARCTLPILLEHIDIDPKRITIMARRLANTSRTRSSANTITEPRFAFRAPDALGARIVH